MKSLLLISLLLCAFSSKATKYHFSTKSGDDSRTAAQAKNHATPWQTLGKLNDFFIELEPGDSILLNRGEVFYGTIIISKSGTSTLPIFIGAYGKGADPVVTGLVPLTWKSAGDHLWVSKEKLDLDALNLVTANGIPAGMGRWPNLDNNNGGYDSIRDNTSNSISDEVGLNSNPSPGKPSYFIGAEIVIRTQRWALDRHPITGYNSTNATISFDASSTNERHSNNFGYFIQDDSTVLDKENEWWYNRDNKKLKIYSEQSPSDVSAANLQNLLTSSGKSYISIDHITFNGCNADAVSLDDGSHFIIQNCTIKNVGRNGVKTTTPDCRFLNNTIVDLMSKGILINQGAEHTLISHNTIRNVSQIAGAGTSQQEDERSTFSGDGVYIKEKSITIEYNNFIKMGYSAVHLTKVDSVIIRHNFIDTVCNVFDDGGAIYIYTGEANDNYGREISNNIILHGIGAFFGSGVYGGSAAGAGVAGIYNDRGTSGVIEHSNTIAYFEKGIFQNYGCNRLTITKNTLYNNIKGIQINTRSEDKTRDLYITKNIAFAAIPSQTTLNIYSGDGAALNKFGTIDSNYYARPIKDHITMSWQSNADTDPHYVSLAGWQKKYPLYDANSKRSPRTVSDTSHVIFEYNRTDASKTILLDEFTYIDMDSVTYSQSVTLQPNASIILIRSSDTVQNVPTVFLTSPADDTTLAAPAWIKLTADAVDANGSVVSVDFYADTTFLGTDSTSPYNYTWKNVRAGKYNLTAVATNTAGLSGSSDTTKIYVTANGMPTVFFTSPSVDTTFTAPASVELNVTAADTDGSIVSVDFFNGTTLLGSDSTSPYTFTWSNVAAGPYLITALATDNNGMSAISDSLNITVTNASGNPTVAITSPTTDAHFTTPGTITINTTAADADGSIVSVDFFNGTTLLGSDTTSPYTFTWNNVAAGKYSITALVTDNNGLTGSSDSVHITVTQSNTNPTVTITSPLADTSLVKPASITISATALDTDGSIAKVEFFDGATLIKTEHSKPYQFTWKNVSAGNHTLTAKATDNDGLFATSAPVTISVGKQKIAPVVYITSPSADTSISKPTSIIITAAARDTDGSIAKVEFYTGSTLIKTEKVRPYTFTWKNTRAGKYILTAKATDNDGMVTTSSPVSITVTSANIAPEVSITSPVTNTHFTSPAAITVTANAKDDDGTIDKVEFYNGTTLIKTEQATPYTFTWKNVRAGKYTLTAKATDNDGMVTTSAAVIIVVASTNIAPEVSITSPVINTEFKSPAAITVTAKARDDDGTIDKVEFYNGTTLIKTEEAWPYTFTWKNVREGKYTLTAKATDNDGTVTTSAAVTITVRAANIAPEVLITSPLGNAHSVAPASIIVTAKARDEDGTIDKVEFYSGTTLIKTEEAWPYTFTWKNVREGKYILTAKATDNDGKVTTSAAVTISVLKKSSGGDLIISEPGDIDYVDMPARRTISTDRSNTINISIGPNPASSVLSIFTNELFKDKEVKISIFSASGMLVKVITANKASKIIQVDVSSFSTGIYVLKIAGKDLVVYKEFKKE